jgi:hypothetical protein
MADFLKILVLLLQAEDGEEANATHLNHAFANHSEEDEIYPLIVKEVAEAQQADAQLKYLFKCNGVLYK